MARTYRHPARVSGYYSKATAMKRMWTNWRTGLPEPTYEEGQWEKWCRDKDFYGRRNGTAYRQGTNDIIRSKDRLNEHRLMKDPDMFDDMDFATKADGKVLIWVIW